jgi:hypothetical protein
MKNWRQFWDSENASLIIEFALLFPVYLAFLFAIFEIGRFMLVAGLIDYGLGITSGRVFQAVSQAQTYNPVTIAQQDLTQYSFNLFVPVAASVSVTAPAPGSKQALIRRQTVSFGANGPSLDVVNVTYVQTIPSQFLRDFLRIPEMRLRASMGVPITQ